MLELWLIAVSTTHYKNVNRQQTKDGRTKALKWYPRLQLNRYLRSILIRVMEGKIKMNFYYISIIVSIGLTRGVQRSIKRKMILVSTYFDN